MSKRTILIKDTDLTLNSEAGECYVCSLGLDHDTVDKFFKQFDEELKEFLAPGTAKQRDVMLFIFNNYSKIEISMAFENIFHQLLTMKDNPKCNTENSEEVFRSMFNGLLG